MKITLEESLVLIRWLEVQLVPKQAHCALMGSILMKGESSKDLDIMIYAHNQVKAPTRSNLLKMIKVIFPGGEILEDTKAYAVERTIYRVELDGRRVEFFFANL